MIPNQRGLESLLCYIFALIKYVLQIFQMMDRNFSYLDLGTFLDYIKGVSCRIGHLFLESMNFLALHRL